MQLLEKSKNIASDVTVGTKKRKIHGMIKCQLGYIMAFI